MKKKVSDPYSGDDEEHEDHEKGKKRNKNKRD